MPRLITALTFNPETFWRLDTYAVNTRRPRGRAAEHLINLALDALEREAGVSKRRAEIANTILESWPHPPASRTFAQIESGVNERLGNAVSAMLLSNVLDEMTSDGRLRYVGGRYALLLAVPQAKSEDAP